MAPNRGYALLLLCIGARSKSILDQVWEQLADLVAGDESEDVERKRIECTYDCAEECGETFDNYYDRDENNPDTCLRNEYRRGEERYLLGGMYCSYVLGGGKIHDEETCLGFKAQEISQRTIAHPSAILALLGAKGVSRPRERRCGVSGTPQCPGPDVTQCPTGMWILPRGQVIRSNASYPSCCDGCPGGSSMCYGDCSCMCADVKYCWQITDEALCGSEKGYPAPPYICGTERQPGVTSRCCWDAATSSCKEAPRSGGLETFEWFKFFVSWSNVTGCTVNADPPSYAAGMKRTTSSLCLHNSELVVMLVVFVGFLFGVSLSVCSIRYGKHTFQYGKWAKKYCHGIIQYEYEGLEEEEEEDKGEKFAMGAKLMAMRSLVSGNGTLALTVLYRTSQVCANACMPMVCMIYLDPPLVLLMYFLFYWVPAYNRVGKEVIHQTFYCVTPPKVSLFGLVKPGQYSFAFLFSALRVFIFPLTLLCVSWGIYEFMDKVRKDPSPGQWVFNTSFFFRAGFMKGEGAMVRDVIQATIVFGSILHTILTLLLLLDQYCNREWVPPLSFRSHDEKLIKKVELVKNELIAVAKQMKETNRERRRGGDVNVVEERTRLFAELYEKCKAEMKEKFGEEGDQMSEIKPYSRLHIALVSGLGLTTFLGFVYKCFLLVSLGRSLTAFFLVAVTSESIAMFVITGVAFRGFKSFNQVWATGVLHVDYVYLTAWIKGLGGLPYLMITLYTLPLANLSQWYNNILVPLFLLKGIFGMALVLIDNIDFDLFAIEHDDGGIVNDIRTSLALCNCHDSATESEDEESDVEDEESLS